jgi:hypothetical protein
MGNKLSVNPWLGMWVRPHETIRAIIQYNTSYLLPLLYWIYGFPIALQLAQNMSMGDQASLLTILLSAVVGAIIIGALGINLGACLFYWTGRWIGGAGTFKEVRAAVAWSSVPSLVNLLIWCTQLAVFGKRIFTLMFLETSFVGAQLGLVFLISVIQIVATVWGVVMLLKALGEAQQFSAWKALLNVFLPLVVIFIGFKLLVWLFFLLTSGVH